jgi:AmiR/NasT family two-component response regulator
MADDALRVLIVEDEPLLGMELEENVVSAGHEVVGWATGRVSAMALADGRSPEFAFVDLRLRDGQTGSEIAQRLAERGVVVVIATANPDEVEVGVREHVLGIVNKPYSAETIDAVLRYAVEKLQRSNAKPAEPPPSV